MGVAVDVGMGVGVVVGVGVLVGVAVAMFDDAIPASLTTPVLEPWQPLTANKRTSTDQALNRPPDRRRGTSRSCQYHRLCP